MVQVPGMCESHGKSLQTVWSGKGVLGAKDGTCNRITDWPRCLYLTVGDRECSDMDQLSLDKLSLE
jgi:hypothetical protein